MFKYAVVCRNLKNIKHPNQEGKVISGFTNDFQCGHKLRVFSEDGEKLISTSKVVKKVEKKGYWVITTRHGSKYEVNVQTDW